MSNPMDFRDVPEIGGRSLEERVEELEVTMDAALRALRELSVMLAGQAELLERVVGEKVLPVRRKRGK